jgi:hypothetical protein
VSDPVVLSNPLDALMTIVSQAINNTQTSLKARNLKVSQIDIQVKTTVTNEETGGLKFSLLSKVDADAECTRSSSSAQTISLTFQPPKQQLEKYGIDLKKEEKELIDAIEIISDAVGNAIQKLPNFTLTNATVQINFDITVGADGSLSFVLAGSLNANKDDANSLTITLKPESIS